MMSVTIYSNIMGNDKHFYEPRMKPQQRGCGDLHSGNWNGFSAFLYLILFLYLLFCYKM